MSSGCSGETPPSQPSQAAASSQATTPGETAVTSTTMQPSQADTPAPVWLPELAPGPHAIGYRQQWFEDPTRSLIDPVTGDRIKRPILLAVWYPSDASVPSGEAMLVDDYLRVAAPKAGAWRARLEQHVQRVRDQEVFDGEPTDELAGLKTMARRDAEWAQGSFPIVLAHPGLGASFADNFVLWEHLASHGFVVVSGAFLDASGLGSAIEWDPGTSIADLDRMFEAAATWPSVDPARVVVIGHSYGAQAALAYAMAGRDLLAVVSLDSTLEYASADDPWYERPEPARYLGRRDKLRIPALIIHAGGRTDYVEGLTHAERTLVSMPGLRHNDFIAHGGVLRAAHTAHADPEIRAGFVQVADAVREFLSQVTTGTERPGAESLPPNWTQLPASPPPADLALVLAWIRELGPAAAYDRCAGQARCDAELLLNDAGYVLARSGSPTLAEQVFATVVDRVPDSWNAWDSWAELAEQQGLTAEAIQRYREALELVRVVERAQGESKGVVHSARIEARLADLASARR
ncbi:Alpha/beta hydrolase family protein [Enhygromyxa salina]|uniref:Alpha/beta hydrolase family protein n=2 Tax=Enhygromyxa salina TaxID=215803 RepID=A0A2S9YNP1_9BACT|nr:Alpha/beta hydrolase family protein [Enhygromyxa salina]